LTVIKPGLFSIQQRFPDCKDSLRRLYRKSESFQGICQNYQECLNAFNHWSGSEDEQAPHRKHEYAELIKELEQEIIQRLEEER